MQRKQFNDLRLELSLSTTPREVSSIFRKHGIKDRITKVLVLENVLTEVKHGNGMYPQVKAFFINALDYSDIQNVFLQKLREYELQELYNKE